MYGNKNLWRFRQAKPASGFHRFVLAILVTAGIGCIAVFSDWWFREEHIQSLWFFILLSIFFWYGLARQLVVWISYLRIRKPKSEFAPTGLSVAIFTTSSPGEPLSMFEKTLEACAAVNYPHTTYLLD